MISSLTLVVPFSFAHVLRGTYDRMPWAGMVKTYNTNAQTPDSAGTATAMNSGYKTKSVNRSLNKGLTFKTERAF